MKKCIVDFTKYFDLIIRNFLLLLTDGITAPICYVIKSVFSDAKYRVWIHDKISSSFMATSGVKQGCTMSSSLSNLYQNDLHDIFNDVKFLLVVWRGQMTCCCCQQVSLAYKDVWICYCPASRTTLVATRFRVAVICPIIQVPHCIRVFFYFVWFVFINHIFQFYYELCTYCNILDIYLS